MSEIFKPFDIRGVWGGNEDQIDEAFFYRVALGLCDEYDKNNYTQPVLIGGDTRVQNTMILLAMVQAFTERDVPYLLTGLPVDSVAQQQHMFGAVSTPLTYWYMQHEFELGICVTASHNPAGWVGMKTVNKDGDLYQSVYIQSLYTRYATTEYVASLNVHKEILARVEADQRHERLQSLRDAYTVLIVSKWEAWINGTTDEECVIVVDYGGGAASGFERALLTAMDKQIDWLTIAHINTEADGTFAHHGTDTSNPLNYEYLGGHVRELNAAFGVMFDGDGDRLGCVDSDGVMIPGDGQLAIIFDQYIQGSKDVGAVVGDISCTNTVRDIAYKHKVKHHFSRVGYRFIKEKIKEVGAPIGGELSGHVLFKETKYTEAPSLIIGLLIQARIEHTVLKVPEIEDKSWHKLLLQNYEVTDKEETIEALVDHFPTASQNRLDGVRLGGDDRWVLIRQSGTEPIIRLYVEAKTSEKAEVVQEQCVGIIKTFMSD